MELKSKFGIQANFRGVVKTVECEGEIKVWVSEQWQCREWIRATLAAPHQPQAKENRNARRGDPHKQKEEQQAGATIPSVTAGLLTNNAWATNKLSGYEGTAREKGGGKG